MKSPTAVREYEFGARTTAYMDMQGVLRPVEGDEIDDRHTALSMCTSHQGTPVYRSEY